MTACVLLAACFMLLGAGGGQPCQHQRTDAEGARALHPCREHHRTDPLGSQQGVGTGGSGCRTGPLQMVSNHHNTQGISTHLNNIDPIETEHQSHLMLYLNVPASESQLGTPR